jgi:hypothetical protein
MFQGFLHSRWCVARRHGSLTYTAQVFEEYGNLWAAVAEEARCPASHFLGSFSGWKQMCTRGLALQSEPGSIELDPLLLRRQLEVRAGLYMMRHYFRSTADG